MSASNNQRVAIYGEWLWGVVHQYISKGAWMHQGCFPAVARDKLDAVIESIAKVYPDFIIVCDGLVRANVDPLPLDTSICRMLTDGDSLEIGDTRGKYTLGLAKLPAEVSALAVNYLMYKYPGKVMRAPYHAHAQIAAFCKSRQVIAAIGGPEGVTAVFNPDRPTYSLESCGLFEETEKKEHFTVYTHMKSPNPKFPKIWNCPIINPFGDINPLCLTFGVTNQEYAPRMELIEEYGSRTLSNAEYMGVAFGALPVDVAFPFTRMSVTQVHQGGLISRISRSEFPDFFPSNEVGEGRSDSFMRPLRSQVHLQMIGDNDRQLSINFGRESLNPPVIELGDWDLGQFPKTDDWCKNINEFVKHAVHTDVHTQRPPNTIKSKTSIQLEARMKSLDLMGYFTHPSDIPISSDERSGTTPYANALAKADTGTEMQVFALIEVHRTQVPLREKLGMTSKNPVAATFLSRLMTLMPLKTKPLESWAGPAYGCINDWVIELTRQQINFRDLTCVMTYRCSLKNALLTTKDLQSSFLFHSFPSPLMGYVMYFLLTRKEEELKAGRHAENMEYVLSKFPQVTKESLSADLQHAYKFLNNLASIFRPIFQSTEEDQQQDYEDFKKFVDHVTSEIHLVKDVLEKLGLKLLSGYTKPRGN